MLSSDAVAIEDEEAIFLNDPDLCLPNAMMHEMDT